MHYDSDIIITLQREREGIGAEGRRDRGIGEEGKKEG